MPNPLRILHVVNSLEPGGMENGVVNLAQTLPEAEFNLTFACLARGGAFAERLPRPGEQVEILGKAGGFSPLAMWRLARIIAGRQPQVVHTHNLGPLIYAAGATLLGRTCPILHGEHSQLSPEEHLPKRLRQRRWLYRACRRVHVVSPSIREELGTLGFPAERLEVVPNGVDTSRFSPGDQIAARAALGLPPEAFVVGIVGRFGPFKRHDLLLAAFAQLAPHWPELHLLVAGAGGSAESSVRALVEGSLHTSRIHWAGLQREPAGCYQALNLLAIPSQNEGFSNVALEAMACATPVLGRLGCGHEVFLQNGRDGIIADLGTPELLAAEIERWRHRPAALAALGRQARETAVHGFSLAAMAARYAALYRAVAGVEGAGAS